MTDSATSGRSSGKKIFFEAQVKDTVDEYAAFLE